MAELDVVREQAMLLSIDERARLIEDLLSSFDPQGQAAIDEAWAVEVEDRIAAFERGEIKAITLEESRRRIFGA